MANVDLDASVESDILNVSLDSGIDNFDFDIDVDFELEPPGSPQDSGCTPTSGCFFYRLWWMANERLLDASLNNDRLNQENVQLQELVNKLLMEKAQRKEKQRLKRMRKRIKKARKIMAKW